MKRVLLFNPENDLALAADSATYTPPLAAQQLHRAGAALPLWYGGEGDCVIAPGVDQRWLHGIQALFGERVRVASLNCAGEWKPEPWGWSRAARRQFHDWGMDGEHLPSDGQLACWRELSHRRTASTVRDAAAETLPFAIAPGGVEARNTSELVHILRRAGGEVIAKSPWSSSGRGLVHSHGLSEGEMVRQCEGIIRRQGSVMIEPAHRRVADFAALYECHGGRCRHVGYSLFETDGRGNYTGNTLASDKRILELLGRLYPAVQIQAAAQAIGRALEHTVAKDYEGKAGVDMLIALNPDGTTLLDACVEINLRNTMGFVAHALTENYLAEGSEGTYKVMRHHNTPLPDTMEVEERRMVSGRISLTPPGGQFRFVAEVHTL